jgi:ribosomal protein S18 acetylase RimI-like enzyme
MNEKDKILINQLANVNIETIHQTFIKAFADYPEPATISAEGLTYMLERRGCDLSLSFGAFDNDELIGFILNGVGDWNGKLTAYDTGTGLTKKYRRRGIATRLFKESLPLLRQNGIVQYLLEVIQTNTSAYDLYLKKGFSVSRKFDYYISPVKDIKIREKYLNHKFPIIKIDKPDWDLFSTFWDFRPSWQNSIDSISRKHDYFTILGISYNGRMIGYGVIENHTGDVPQIAVEKTFRQNGLATTLLKHLLQHSESDQIRIINASSDNKPFKRFARSVNLKPGLGQYEMILQL